VLTLAAKGTVQQFFVARGMLVVAHSVISAIGSGFTLPIRGKFGKGAFCTENAFILTIAYRLNFNRIFPDKIPLFVLIPQKTSING
jgi:hypothetical protein